MTPMLAMVGLAVGSWLLRALFIVLVPAERLPTGVSGALTHLAPAVLAALVAVEVVGAVQDLDLTATALVLGSLVLAGVAVRVTGSMGLAVTIGLGAALLVDLALV